MANDGEIVESVSEIFRFARFTARNAVRMYFEPLQWLRLRHSNDMQKQAVGHELPADGERTAIVNAYIDEAVEELTPAQAVERADIPATERIEDTLLKSYLQLYSGPDVDQTIAKALEGLNADLLDYLHRDRSYSQIGAHEFEKLVAAVFTGAGLSVRQTTATRDGGVDIIFVQRPNDTRGPVWLVECKRWSPQSVSLDVVRSLWAPRATPSVRAGLLATTWTFKREKERFRTSKWDLSLRDYKAVLDWINAYQPNPDGILELKDDELVVAPRS